MSSSTDLSNPWATLDGLLGIETVAVNPDLSVGELAFYGRCSTEDNQDPETSRGWQLGNARKFVEPYGGAVSAEFFDVGQSRSVPWDRRREGARLLAALKDPRRTWTGVVVGEGTRCWFGNQFSLIAPRFAAYGVELWVPELGGKFDPRNPSHKMLMSVLGGMSESERQHVQARVRAAMDTQVVNEGRHQGGRAPYGYVVADGGPHPNPRKAAEGFRLRVLAIDDAAAEVVRRIFAEYVAGNGDRAIAGMLNTRRCAVPVGAAARSEPPPSRRRLAGQHRAGDSRQPALHGLRGVRAMGAARDAARPGRRGRRSRDAVPASCAGADRALSYTRASGYRVRRAVHAGAVAPPDQECRWPGHRTEGRAGSESVTRRPYLLRGMVHCGACGRGCRARSCASDATTGATRTTWLPARGAGEPSRTVNLREDVVSAVNGWIGPLFVPQHREPRFGRWWRRKAIRERWRGGRGATAARRGRRDAPPLPGGDRGRRRSDGDRRPDQPGTGRTGRRASEPGAPRTATGAVHRSAGRAIIDELGDVGAAMGTPVPTGLPSSTASGHRRALRAVRLRRVSHSDHACG